MMKYFLLKMAIPVFVVIAFLVALSIASIAIWIIPFVNPPQNEGVTS